MLFIKYYKLGHTNVEQGAEGRVLHDTAWGAPGVGPAPDSQWEVTDGLRLALLTFVQPSHLLPEA